ncbi:MAG: acyl--CoA ligase [Bryobacterales bacterium]|nr:acyl--CoA ligase [Bryobacterales bacterium]
MNTADYLLERADERRPAILTQKGSHSFGQLKAACARLAGEFTAAGVLPGQRIGILGENSLFWVASYLAALKVNAVAVPLPTVATAEDLARRQQLVRCSAVCLDRRHRIKLDGALGEDVRRITEKVLETPGPARWDAPETGSGLDQDAALMLTSGTTAQPRAVRITHRNIQANTDSIVQYLALDNSDRILVVLPFFYCFGTSLLHTHLRAGGSLALCNTFVFPETALQMLERRQCTGIAGVPSTYQTLLRNSTFKRRRFPGLRKVQQAGGRLQPVLIRELADAAPQARVFVMYGQTEATARLSYLPPEMLEKKLGSIGKGIPGVQLRVVDDSGRDVRPGESGEIVAAGGNIAPGYWGDPEASAARFSGGELRTGDIATVDEDGYIYLLGRKSDFIKTLGHRVSSEEVEAKVLEVPDVVAAAAVGLPDPLRGEAIVVFVALRKGSRITMESVLDHCRRSMARHLVPTRLIEIDSLPVNSHGKVVKSVLRERAGSHGDAV